LGLLAPLVAVNTQRNGTGGNLVSGVSTGILMTEPQWYSTAAAGVLLENAVGTVSPRRMRLAVAMGGACRIWHPARSFPTRHRPER
jgi:hypothetical protein